jgi:hypothetical protein
MRLTRALLPVAGLARAALFLLGLVLVGMFLLPGRVEADSAASSAGLAAPEQERYVVVTLVAGGGSVTKSPDQPLYYAGDQVTLEANPALGWAFSHWSGALTGSENPKTLTVTDNHTVLATFTEVRYTVTTQVVGQGSIQRDPDRASYDAGEEVELRAVPGPGWLFSEWSGDLTGATNPQTLVMDGNKTVTATFYEPNWYSLTTEVVGQGSINRDPAQSAYYEGQQVELRAAPVPGWRFAGWSGDLSGSVNPKTLTMDSDTHAIATFERIEYTLTVSVAGQGQVTADPQQLTYYYGDEVTLTASSDPGWAFEYWSGDIGGSKNPRTITIGSNMQVTAHFVERPYLLSIEIVGQGTVVRDPSKPAYYYGDSVTLTANPAPGWRFVGWSGDLTGSQNPRTLAISDDLEITATFARIQYTLTVQVSGQGQVTRSPNQATYFHGDVVTLAAAPALGWSLDHWSGDATGNQNPKTITITKNTEITANFTRDEYTLTIQVVGQGSVGRSPQKLTYYYGDQVVLTATADPGWRFSGWSGGTSGAQNPKTITMTGDTQITATFVWIEYVIDVTIEGRGKVLLKPNRPTFHLGERVTLTGWAPLGWQFDSWGGDVSGDSESVELVVAGDHQVTARFVPDPPGTRYAAMLPWIVEAWPPLPDEPAMLGIKNPEGVGDYTVRWGASLWAKTYTLQEARNQVFSGAVQLYQGPLTYYQVFGRGAGRYFYRTKAHNSWGDSGWSSTSWVDVRLEKEPNDEPLTQANGPIMSGLTYFGRFHSGADLVDYYTFELAARRGVEASLTEISVGHNYDLVLEDAGLRRMGRSEQPGNADEFFRTGELEPGRYYIRVVNTSRTGSSVPYHLRVVYQ